MYLTTRLFILLGMGLLLSCGPAGGSGGPDGDPQPERKTGYGQVAEGQINGQNWVFRSGRAHVVRRPGGDYLVLHLWSQLYADPCREKRGSDLQVRLTAPRELGSWQIDLEDPFNSRLAIFFSDLVFKPQPRDNMRADRGDVILLAIDKNHVSGAFSGSFRHPKVGGTAILGDFIVPICKNRVSFRDNF